MIARLTDAEILCMHKWMWTDMQKALGDNPSPSDRIDYKDIWCDERDLIIPHNCFLCLNAQRYDPKQGNVRNCDQCLVVWPDGNCHSTGFFLYSKISDILDLPTRELSSNRRTLIRMRECDIEELKRRMEKESDIHDGGTD